MPITLAHSGRIALAEVMITRQLVLAVGSGDAAWGNNPPDLSGTETALIAPVALVRARSKHFLSPAPALPLPAPSTVLVELLNDDGVIEMSDFSTWVVSPTPTEHILAVFVLGLRDGPLETLREIAVHVDPVIDPAVPPGRNYIPWADVASAGHSPGRYFGARRFRPKERNGARQWFAEMITL
jgi:hypothetical protein